jgi:hypothetical protein
VIAAISTAKPALRKLSAAAACEISAAHWANSARANTRLRTAKPTADAHTSSPAAEVHPTSGAADTHAAAGHAASAATAAAMHPASAAPTVHTASATTAPLLRGRKQFCAFSARARFHTAWT